MELLANDYVEIFRSPDPKTTFCYTPSLLKLESGRILASFDLGGVNRVIPKDLPDAEKRGRICASDDGGKTWVHKAGRDFCHGRLFEAGGSVYVLGHHGDLTVIRSDDGGETWGPECELTHGESWHQSACGVWKEWPYIYLVMETRWLNGDEPWNNGWWGPNLLAPVVMRGDMRKDLTRRESWLFSEKKRFRDVVGEVEPNNLFGVPFFPSALDMPAADPPVGTQDAKLYKRVYDFEKDEPALGFYAMPSGWLETNLTKITDPTHYWYDPSGHTFHLFMRAHTGGSGYCCVMKAVERVRNGQEVIELEPQLNPSGRPVIYLPMPGGQMKFYVKYDEVTHLYWLLSTQATDTMRRMECLSDDRYNIPCDQRDRLALHYSRNMVDWCFAGLVAKGNGDKESRHYACLEIDGDDLIAASRSGDELASDAHNGDMITFHRIRNFRSLVY